MAHLIAQGGSTLYKIALDTGTATTLTLPTGVTLATTLRPRFAILNQWVVMTNSPNKNLAIDPEGTVYVMTPVAADHPPYVAAGSGSGLTGTYSYKVSYVVLNSDGQLLMESPLSPASDAVSIANKNLALTFVPTSSDSITARRVYRTLSNGDVYYHVSDIDGNTQASLLENASDASVELLPAATEILVSPPGTLPGVRLKNIVQWKSRLWGVSDDPSLVDTVFISETNKVYAWPNSLVAYPTGQDSQGIVAFAPRRNQLGLLKRDGLWQVSGTSSGTGISINNLSVVQIGFGKAGCIASDSVVIVNDKVWWLGRDGVYQWDDNGVNSISDDTVSAWFTTDTYFNRTRFSSVFAKYNEITDQVEFHLAATGSSTEDRWVAYSLTTKSWYGPHKTGLFTPASAASVVDGNGLPITLVGATSGIVYTANSSLYRDGSSTAIDMDCYGPFHHGDAPDIEHYWGELSVLSKIESAGTLTVTPYVGRLDASAGTAISHDLTKGRERLRRLGAGAMCRLRLQNSTVNQRATLYGYEIPFHELGRR